MVPVRVVSRTARLGLAVGFCILGGLGAAGGEPSARARDDGAAGESSARARDDGAAGESSARATDDEAGGDQGPADSEADAVTNSAAAGVQTRIAPEAMTGYQPEGGRDVALYEVPITGVIDLGLAPMVERLVAAANDDENGLILLRVKTDGGRVDAAVRIREALLSAQVPVVTFVDRRAISAGALITLASDTVIMSPGAAYGDAMPVQAGGGGEMKATGEKVVSYMRSIMRSTAEAKGRPSDLAAAMVDPDLAIEGVIKEGKLLTLTSDRALELEMAEAITPDYEDAIELLNLAGAERVEAGVNWAEQVARWLTHPAVSSLLMTFGFLGLLLELYSPGFGVGGFIGLACLFLFFFGQYAANLAGWEEILLFVGGFILLLLELLVIPGFGIAGIPGIIAMVAALILAMVELELPLNVSWDLGYLQEAIGWAAIRLAITLVVVLLAAVYLYRRFPRTNIGRWLVLSDNTAAGKGYVSSRAEVSEELIGKEGVTTTVLRPQGTAEIAGVRRDVASDSGFIDRGRKVRVVGVDGMRVIVRETAPPAADDEDETHHLPA